METEERHPFERRPVGTEDPMSIRVRHLIEEVQALKQQSRDLEREAKNRAAAIAAGQERVETTRQDGVKIVENLEINRLQIFFPGKPSAEMRDKLKRGGFRWAPTEGAWQRQLNNSARYAADYALKGL